MKSEKHEWTLEGLGCANCARKIESAVQKMDGVTSASLDFVNCKLNIELSEGYDPNNIMNNVESVMCSIEPGSSIKKEGLREETEKNKALSGKSRMAIYIIGALCFVTGIILPSKTPAESVFFIVSYLIFGGTVIVNSLKNIAAGRVFDENFLMTVATIGAFILGQYPEGAAVMMFYQLGELFQDYAINQSRKSIKKLMNIKPEFANIKTGEGVESIPPANVRIGDRVIVCPGERIPLDGVIEDGSSSLDTSPLTGESIPKDVAAGDEVLSGCINLNGVLTVQVTKTFGQSAVSRVLELVEGAARRKAVTERFITRFAALYTPIIVGLAALLAFLPPLLTGSALGPWVYRALIFLVISCPCALVISIPLGFFGGIGAASKNGILVKGGNYLEALAKAGTVVFDKTGTLTTGTFEIVGINPAKGFTKQKVLEYAAMAEGYSSHPLARSVIKKYGDNPDLNRVKDYSEVPGKGVSATVDGKAVLCGNVRLLESKGVTVNAENSRGTSLYVAVNGAFAGNIILSDTIKPDVRYALSSLANLGIRDTVMLTGDGEDAAADIAERAGIKRYFAHLLPQDKVSRLEKIMDERVSKQPVAFVGDGINDAAVIARADIGIAMGGLGCDAAIEAADIVIMNDEPHKLCDAILIARKTRTVVFQNIVLAIAVKLLVLALGAGGMATLWEAVFADVGVALLAVINSMRTMRYEQPVKVKQPEESLN